MIESSTVFATAFALSQVCLSAMLLLQRIRMSTLSERIYATLLLAILIYLSVPYLEQWGSNTGWRHLVFLQSAVPGLFWLFSASLFDDHFHLRGWQVSLVVASVLMPMLAFMVAVGSDTWLYMLLVGVPQFLEFLMLLLTLWAVFEYWSVDLVEPRRQLRFWFCAINGTFIFALIFLREFLFANDHWYIVVHGFQGGDAKGFGDRRHDIQICHLIDLTDFVAS